MGAVACTDVVQQRTRATPRVSGSEEVPALRATLRVGAELTEAGVWGPRSQSKDHQHTGSRNQIPLCQGHVRDGQGHASCPCPWGWGRPSQRMQIQRLQTNGGHWWESHIGGKASGDLVLVQAPTFPEEALTVSISRHLPESWGVSLEKQGACTRGYLLPY